MRFLWIWLTLLPFALTNTFMKFGDGTWWEDKPQPVVVIAMLFIGFIFLSIEGAQLKLPWQLFLFHDVSGSEAIFFSERSG